MCSLVSIPLNSLICVSPHQHLFLSCRMKQQNGCLKEQLPITLDNFDWQEFKVVCSITLDAVVFDRETFEHFLILWLILVFCLRFSPNIARSGNHISLSLRLSQCVRVILVSRYGPCVSRYRCVIIFCSDTSDVLFLLQNSVNALW